MIRIFSFDREKRLSSWFSVDLSAKCQCLWHGSKGAFAFSNLVFFFISPSFSFQVEFLSYWHSSLANFAKSRGLSKALRRSIHDNRWSWCFGKVKSRVIPLCRNAWYQQTNWCAKTYSRNGKHHNIYLATRGNDVDIDYLSLEWFQQTNRYCKTYSRNGKHLNYLGIRSNDVDIDYLSLDI
jgi:hypothetical protein